MASFLDIDLTKPLAITPCVMKKLTEPDMLRVLEPMGEPNLLKIDTPIGDIITLDPSAASAFMDWLLQSRWRPVLEADLQCMTETAQGEPLLTTWLQLDSLKVLVDDAKHIAALEPVRTALATWAEQGVGNVYIEGYDRRQRPAPVDPEPGTTSIERHKLYPFVRVGLVHDLDPATKELDTAAPTAWALEVDGVLQLGSYGSKTDALSEVELVVFAEWNLDSLIPAMIEKAVGEGDTELALRLAEGKGRAVGHAAAYNTFFNAMRSTYDTLRTTEPRQGR